MSYEYIDEKRVSDPHALPDVEIFHSEDYLFQQLGLLETVQKDGITQDASWHGEPGFYYAHGFPGCLWDSDPIGPFETYSIALEQAREDSGVYDREEKT